MKRRDFLIGSSAASAAALVGCGQPREGESAQLDFHIDWTPGLDYIGFYIAKEIGAYRDNGFSTTIIPGQGAEASATLLFERAIGIGTTTVDAFLRAYSSGNYDLSLAPKIGAVIFDENPVVLLSPASSPILSPEDLVGRKIGYADESSVTYRQLNLLISDLIASDPSIRVVSSSPQDDPPDDDTIALVRDNYSGPSLLMAGDLQAIVAYTTDAPVRLQLDQYEYASARLSHFGVDTPGMCVAVSNDFPSDDIQGEGRLAVQAACEGWEYTRRNQEDALQMFLALFPEFREREGRLSLDETLSLLPSDRGLAAYMDAETIRSSLQRAGDVLGRMAGTQYDLPFDDLIL